MEIISTNPDRFASISSFLPVEIVADVNTTVLHNIDSQCQLIDGELNKLKTGMIEVGRLLESIQRQVKEVCNKNDRLRNSQEIFELIIEKRFQKKLTWAYSMINVFLRFAGDEFFVENYSSSVLFSLSRLEPNELESIRGNLEGGKPLTKEEARVLVSSIVSQRVNDDEIKSLEEQVTATTAEKNALTKQLEREKAEKESIQRDFQSNQESHNQLMQTLREQQDRESNLLASLNAAREEKVKALADLEAAKKSKPAETIEVEIEVPPKGYTTIQDALDDINAKLEEQQRAYDAISKQMEEAQKLFNETQQVNQYLSELLSAASDLVIKQHEVLNKCRSSDLKQSSEVLQKIADMGKKLSEDALRQIA